MMRYILFLFFTLFLQDYNGWSQLPETNIYLFEVQRNPRGMTLSAPRIIGSKKGYNNQPWFLPDGSGMFYVRSMDTVNTEIFYYDFKKKKSKRITKTKEAEYSPKLTPDMERISCVRVEKDRTTQHFFSYNKKGKQAFLMQPGLTSIGYYDWVNMNEWISFELPEPFYLVRHKVSPAVTDTLVNRVGRSFYYLRSKNVLVFVDKSDSLNGRIRMLDKQHLKSPTPSEPERNPVLSDVLPGEEDFCFMQDGSILMFHDGAIYKKRNPFKLKDSKWELLWDMKPWGINKGYRISLSPDNTRLALVVYSGEKP